MSAIRRLFSTTDKFSVLQWRFDVIILLFLKNLPIRDNLRIRDNALCIRLFPHVSITKGPFGYNTMNKRVPLVSMVSGVYGVCGAFGVYGVLSIIGFSKHQA